MTQLMSTPLPLRLWRSAATTQLTLIPLPARQQDARLWRSAATPQLTLIPSLARVSGGVETSRQPCECQPSKKRALRD